MGVYIRAYRADTPAGEPGTPIRFVASTEGVARDGMVIEADGWQLDNYRRNPVFLWAHRYSEPPIGKAADVRVEGGQLIADIVFDQDDERARSIESKYRNGFLRAVSVGFDVESIQPPKGPMAAPRVTRAELLEISAVPVPADPEALMSRQRAADDAEAALDWETISGELVALYCYPLERPIRAWRSSVHSLCRAYAALGKEPPERLAPDYLATLDSEAIAGLFLEDEAERHAHVFAQHRQRQAPGTALPTAVRNHLTALRRLCDDLLTPADASPSEPEPTPEPSTDDAALAEAARALLNRWSTNHE